MNKPEKLNIAILPTPLTELERLTKKIGKARIFIKRDDMTGLGMGGNKLRKLDYLVKYALDNGYTTLLTIGGNQTNHGRLTVAAAAQNGLKSIIVCMGKPTPEMSGNQVLDKIMGCDLVFVDTSALPQDLAPDEIRQKSMQYVGECIDKVVTEREAQGEKVLVIPIGGSSPLGSLGYFDCVKEILDQMEASGEKIDYVVMSNGSAGTYAGLLLGAKYYNAPFKIIASNVSPLNDLEKRAEEIRKLMNETSRVYDMGITVERDEMELIADFAGPGYNIPDEITRETIYEVARTEAVLLDPVYTGKGFTALLDMVEKEIIPADSSVLFIHTGGAPALWSENHRQAFEEDLWGEQKTFVYTE